MYAIRSYYVLPANPRTTLCPASIDAKIFRLYDGNKLQSGVETSGALHSVTTLQAMDLEETPFVVSAEPMVLQPGESRCIQVLLYPLGLRNQSSGKLLILTPDDAVVEFVITSYSIHYTKLYDSL